MTQQFRAAVMGEFVFFCQKSPDTIDLEMLTALITEFSGTPIRTTTVPEDVKSPKAKKAKKAKKAQESCEFCRMPEPNPDKCMSRSFGKGCGTQCTRKSKDGDFCGMHTKQLSESGDPPFGRIDEPRHLMKRGDETNECGWKHFKDDGTGVEDTSDETVGVGPNEDIQSVVDDLVKAVQEVDSDLEIDHPDPAATQESMDLAPVPMAPVTTESQPPVPESKAPVPELQSPVPESKAPVPELQPPVPESKAPVPEIQPPVQEGSHSADPEEDPDVDPNIDAPGPAATQEPQSPVPKAPVQESKAPVQESKAPVPEDKVSVPEPSADVQEAPGGDQESQEHPASDSDGSDTEDMTDNEQSIRNGVYQGVEYVFDSSDDICIVKKFNKKTYQLKDVGAYDEDEDEIEFNGYLATHQAHITDEDQIAVKWID
jgi:hypothetical protein